MGQSTNLNWWVDPGIGGMSWGLVGWVGALKLTARFASENQRQALGFCGFPPEWWLQDEFHFLNRGVGSAYFEGRMLLVLRDFKPLIFMGQLAVIVSRSLPVDDVSWCRLTNGAFHPGADWGTDIPCAGSLFFLTKISMNIPYLQ